MCKRNIEDPLLRTFLDRYGLHLLSVPREKVLVGDVYVKDDGKVSPGGNVSHLLEPPLNVQPTTSGEVMADVAGSISSGVKADVALGLLEGFFAVTGAVGFAGRLKTAFESKRARSIRFRFANATRDSVDVALLGRSIWKHRISIRNALFDESNQYYLVTAVARTPSISIRAEAEGGRALHLDVAAIALGETGTKLAVEKSGDGEITFSSDKSLAFGVELHELRYEPDQRVLKLKNPPDAMRLRKAEGDTRSAAPAFIGGPEGDIFLPLSNSRESAAT